MRTRESLEEEITMLRAEVRRQDERLRDQRRELHQRFQMETEALNGQIKYLTKLITDAVNVCPLHHMHGPLIIKKDEFLIGETGR